MESVFFYNEKIGKDVTKILKEDTFMRIGYTVIESDILQTEREGYFLYVQANSEEINLIEERLKDLGAEKLTGTEEKAIIDTINTKEEDAASGMGMIFG